MDKDRITGSLKKAEGKLTNDGAREKQGKTEDAWGKTKDKARDAKDKIDERT